MEDKIKALAEELEIDVEDITENTWGEFEAEGAEYLVLTDEEAEEKAAEYIKETLWAFNAGFLASHLGCPEETVQAVLNNGNCESNNDIFLEWIKNCGDLEKFIEDAICADGMGHFLSGYDGNELEQGGFFIYRTN